MKARVFVVGAFVIVTGLGLAAVWTAKGVDLSGRLGASALVLLFAFLFAGMALFIPEDDL